MTTQACHATLDDVAAQLAARRITSVELVEACLAQIAKIDPDLSAYRRLFADRALEQARASDRRRNLEGARSSIDGIPVSIKDVFCVAGYPATAGSLVDADVKARRTAAAIQRLERAGAVILGAAHMDEFGLGHAPSRHLATPRNPVDTAYATGGSSSGSAAGVAAHLCFASIVTDTAGSARAPASYCGLVGFKPTRGWASMTGAIGLAPSFDTVGILTRTVLDCHHVFQTMHGRSSMTDRDETRISRPALSPLAGLDIGFLDERELEEVEPDVLSRYDTAVGLADNLGARLRPWTWRGFARASEVLSLIVRAEAAALHGHTVRADPCLVSKPVQDQLRRGLSVSATEYLHALDEVRSLASDFDRSVRPLAAVILPTCAETAPRIADPEQMISKRLPNRFRSPFNLAGAPAITVPFGRGQNGMPIGVQIVAGRHHDERLLQIARHFEVTSRGGESEKRDAG